MAKFNTGQSFADGDTVTGAKLNNITSQLNIYTGVISEQTAMSATVSTADQLLIADTDNGDSGSANRITVQKLFSDSLTNGTYATVNLTGTITSNRTVATSATITTGTITNLNSTTGTIATLNSTTGTIATLNSTTGTIATLNSTTGTIATLNSTTGTIATLNSTTGTIGNFSTTLAGDFTISQGTGTIGTAKVTPTNLSQPFTSGTAVASTSGTAIDFTGIPSWVKRITLMLNGVSTDGVAPYILQLGTSSGIVTNGYVSTRNTLYSSIQVAQSTSGFDLLEGTAALFHGGSVIISYFGSSNTWVVSGVIASSAAIAFTTSGYSPNLGGALDRIRLKTTDTFDGGSVNIMYEG